MRTFLFIVYDIVSHIERKINYFILFFILFKGWVSWKFPQLIHEHPKLPLIEFNYRIQIIDTLFAV
jgi:hypothetical protein